MAIKSETIIQGIEIQGDKAVEAALNRVGDAGADALARLNKAGENVGTGLADATGRIQTATGRIANAFSALGKVVTDFTSGFIEGAKEAAAEGTKDFDKTAKAAENMGGRLQGVRKVFSDFFAGIKQGADEAALERGFTRSQAAARGLRGAIGDLAGSVTSFVGRIGLIAAASGLGFGRFIRMARTAALSVERITEVTSSAEEAASRAFISATQRSMQYQSSVADLRRQLVQGRVSFDDYSKSMSDLVAKQREAESQARIMQDLEAREQKALEETRKKIQEKNALLQLEQRFGVQGAQAVLKIGEAVVKVQQLILKVFGPALMSAANAITNFIQTNSADIDAFLQDVIAKFTPIFDRIRQGFAGVDFGATLGTVATIINNVVIPAFNLLLDAANGVASAVNSIFGTDFTGAGLLAAFVLLKVSGAVDLVTNSVGLLSKAVGFLLLKFTPWQLLIGLIITALIALGLYLAKLDWAGLLKAAQDAWQQIKDAFVNAADTIRQKWNGIFGWFGEKLDWLIEKYKSAVAWAKRLVGASAEATAQAGGGPAGGGNFAGGGRVFGPGTQTSDSIPAWLSRDEWVIRAKAAQYYGSRVMAAINGMAIPREAFGRRFNMGGLVQGAAAALAIPTPRLALATGGAVGPAAKAMRPLELVLDGQRFGGMLAPADTADSLVKYSISRQTRSAGRKPGWYGGKK